MCYSPVPGDCAEGKHLPTRCCSGAIHIRWNLDSRIWQVSAAYELKIELWTQWML